MTEREARALGTVVAKTSDGVRVKFGRTNGRRCLHLIVGRQDDREASSHTIYGAREWDAHPANRANRPRKRAAAQAFETELERLNPQTVIDAAILAAVANKEAQ